MNKIQKFYLKFKNYIGENNFLPPEDPLGELCHLEMGLRRFCFEHNQKLSLEIGTKKKEIYLDPDIILILDELPDNLHQLLIGQKIDLDFPESGMIIHLEPIDIWTINCTWQEYGYVLEKNTFLLEKIQVLYVLKDFLDKIISKAVKKGYITEVEKNQFMMRGR